MVSISLRNKSLFYEKIKSNDTVLFAFKGSVNQWMEFRRFVANRSDLVSIQDVSDADMTIKVKKIADLSSKTSITVGILFSGRDQEKEDLYACMASFRNEAIVGEIVILSSRAVVLDKSMFRELPIRVIELPIETDPRILYTVKKNWIIMNSIYDYVLIVHTRIRYVAGLNCVNSKYWDIASGHVTYQGRSNLDLMLTKRSASGLRYVRSDMVLSQRRSKWGSYVDGGCFLVRKGHLASLLDEGLAWGEQEDYDFCAANSLKSREIVKFNELKFETVTNKIRYKHPFIVFLVRVVNLARWY